MSATEARAGVLQAGAARGDASGTESLTPMLQQYYSVKAEYPDAILLFRLGDFYEMFGEDAKIGASALEITLTGRDAGPRGRVPMCGVPYHAVDGYLARLVKAGYRVAVCEQMEDPKKARGIVRREIIRIVTPGTLTDGKVLEPNAPNYLMAVAFGGGEAGAAWVDVSTGLFEAAQFGGVEWLERFRAELARLCPAEIIVAQEAESPAPQLASAPQPASETQPPPSWLDGLGLEALVTVRPSRDFSPVVARDRLCRHFGTASLDGFGLSQGVDGASSLCVSAAGACLQYLAETQKSSLRHINRIHLRQGADFLLLDPATRRNLELTETMRDHSRKGSLLWLLDKTVTAMGGRLLRSWVEQPLLSPTAINERLDAVEDLASDAFCRARLRAALADVKDLERLVGKVDNGLANPRDLVALRDSLAALPKVVGILVEPGSSGGGGNPKRARRLGVLASKAEPLPDLEKLLRVAVNDDASVALHEGNIIKDEYDPEVDRLREAQRSGKEWIASLEARERAVTGIKSLRVGFNRVFGYYIEVTRANLPQVPPTYQRKQTLSGAERFVTAELKEYEERILGAEEKLIAREYELFCALRDEVSGQTARIQRTARAVAELDALASLSEVAVQNNYVRPTVDLEDCIDIKEGRHPVVEKTLSGALFVPNDCTLGGDGARFILITGPNMAGKSTYLRQVALIVLMAQVGSFVPAAAASVGIVDRIFTRVGAADDLAGGQSTFMVEMSEVANILNNATPRSLVLLDEVGRGTSTFDGLSIAWAVTEYLHDPGQLGAKTLFATHYHELTLLVDELPRAANLNVGARVVDGKITFLHRLEEGGADKSYGIEVARLAGVPVAVLDRAAAVLAELEENNAVTVNVRLEDGESRRRAVLSVGQPRGRARQEREARGQLSLLGGGAGDSSGRVAKGLAAEVAALDLDGLTPRQAQEVLYRLRERAREVVKPDGSDTNPF